MGLFGDYEDKETSMAAIKDEAADLAPAVCGIGHGLVWGEGSLNARAAIVGEAPGDKEEQLSRPFVGPAGQLLDKELERVELRRDDVWITNVVKCRPTRHEGGRVTNRTPSTKEVRQWMGLLERELKIVRPEIIICMGGLAANALIHKDFRIAEERGRWFTSIFGPQAIATYHPAYLLRQLDENWNRTIEEFRSDLRMAAGEMKNAA